MREVYIGNGATIHVDEDKNNFHYLDMNKLKEIVENNEGKEIYVGTYRDWCWTAKKIKGLQHINDIMSGRDYILRCSCWDTFVVRIGDEVIPCTVDIPIYLHQLAQNAGFCDGLFKIEQWIGTIYTGCIAKMDYEHIQEMIAEIKPIVEKYKEKINKNTELLEAK